MGEVIRSACRHIARRRGRALLTAGGVLIGVWMVTLVTLVGAAGADAVNGELQSMGLQGLSVSAVSGEILDENCLSAIRSVNGVRAAMPLVTVGGRGTLGDYTFTAYVGGIDAGARQVVSLETAAGRLFRESDVRAGAPVCVVDEAVALAAYGSSNAVGRTLTLSVGETTLTLRVVGVAKAGSSLLQSVSGYLSGLVYLPYTTLQEVSGKQTFTQIAVQMAEDDRTETVRRQVIAALERSTGETDRFAAEDLAAQRGRLTRILDVVSWVLTAVSAVSLVVAGTGMLTSLLTAVNERVREIGIKQALGATHRRIMAEFLTESLLLAAGGATAGIAVGAAVGVGGLAVFGLTPVMPWGRLCLVWTVTVLLGGVFGWYPARRAAALHPAEALRAQIG